ncbi:uncharacterized protein LOC143289736 [Babylonia areolata]|uniref:uncharacterized protein LOC143289736 n=1 Tax=Babylonia areolata TaxID=304850 RepID=UPI003FD1ABA4
MCIYIYITRLQDSVGLIVSITLTELFKCIRNVRLPATQVDTPAKILAVLEENWGDQRDATELATTFFNRQQQPKETVIDYASHLQHLWTKVNKAEDGMIQVSATILRDAFARGLQPATLKRDVRRLIRYHPDTTFEAAKKEALRWLREDSHTYNICPGVDNTTVVRLQSQLATLAAENTSLRRQLQSPMPAHSPLPPQPALHPQRCAAEHTPDLSHCVWCERSGHTEHQCRHKRRYKARQQNADHQPAAPAHNQCVATTHTGRPGPMPSTAPAPNQRCRRRRRRRHHSTTPDAVVPRMSPPVISPAPQRSSQQPPSVTPTDPVSLHHQGDKVTDTDTDSDSGMWLTRPMPRPRTPTQRAAPEPPPLPPDPAPRRSTRLATRTPLTVF